MPKPLVVLASDANSVGREAARLVDDSLTAGHLRTLGVATGSSPLPLYRALAHLWRNTHSARNIAAFALDEYVGLRPSHPQSYHAVVAREVTAPLNLNRQNVHVPGPGTDDIERAGEHYEELITLAGGVDVQILGIGGNGHIGFNEPGSAPDSRTRVVDLAEGTRRANARFFRSLSEVPRRAVTQGIGTILDARQVLVIAHGATKAGLLGRAFDGPITPDFPASYLQRHPHVTVVADHVAAEGLAPRHLLEGVHL